VLPSSTSFSLLGNPPLSPLDLTKIFFPWVFSFPPLLQAGTQGYQSPPSPSSAPQTILSFHACDPISLPFPALSSFTRLYLCLPFNFAPIPSLYFAGPLLPSTRTMSLSRGQIPSGHKHIFNTPWRREHDYWWCLFFPPPPAFARPL